MYLFAVTLDVKLLREDALPPVAPSEGNAGYDIVASDTIPLCAQTSLLYTVPVAFKIPTGYVGLVLGRSGMAIRDNVHVAHIGVIDSNYRGPLKILLRNQGLTDYTMQRGDRIAQLCILPHFRGAVSVVDDLGETARGEKGFGSSGR